MQRGARGRGIGHSRVDTELAFEWTWTPRERARVAIQCALGERPLAGETSAWAWAWARRQAQAGVYEGGVELGRRGCVRTRRGRCCGEHNAVLQRIMADICVDKRGTYL